jgi:hypothetical protein
MNAVAIKKGQTRVKAPDFQTMGTVKCEGCGEQFIIAHDPGSADPQRAEIQAKWLEKSFAAEHELSREHPDKIELPD